MDGSPEDLPAARGETIDPRVQYIHTGKKIGVSNHAAAVRNLGLQHVQTPWVAFVDDDDTIDTQYVNILHHEVQQNEDAHIIIFRMKYTDGRVLPPHDHTDFVLNHVGISFAMKMDYVRDKSLTFRPSSTEDFELLDRCRQAGASIRISPSITYYVRPAASQDKEHKAALLLVLLVLGTFAGAWLVYWRFCGKRTASPGPGILQGK